MAGKQVISTKNQPLNCTSLYLDIFERKKTPKFGEKIDPCDTMHILSHNIYFNKAFVTWHYRQSCFCRNLSKAFNMVRRQIIRQWSILSIKSLGNPATDAWTVKACCYGGFADKWPQIWRIFADCADLLVKKSVEICVIRKNQCSNYALRDSCVRHVRNPLVQNFVASPSKEVKSSEQNHLRCVLYAKLIERGAKWKDSGVQQQCFWLWS